VRGDSVLIDVVVPRRSCLKSSALTLAPPCAGPAGSSPLPPLAPGDAPVVEELPPQPQLEVTPPVMGVLEYARHLIARRAGSSATRASAGSSDSESDFEAMPHRKVRDVVMDMPLCSEPREAGVSLGSRLKSRGGWRLLGQLGCPAAQHSVIDRGSRNSRSPRGGGSMSLTAAVVEVRLTPS
jgi:hypothetical protein